jgi:hypothetical protein
MRRRLLVTTAVAVGLFALACTDERQESPTEPPSTATTAKSCPSSDPRQSLICDLFPANDLRQSATDFYNNIKTKLPKDPAFANARAVDLINFTFKQYYAGKLLDPPGSLTTEGGVVQLTCSVLDYVGSGWTNCSTDLTTGLNTTSASPHSTIQVCGPAGCLVRPPDKHSGVSVPPDACPTLCIIAVDPIPPNFAFPRRGPLFGLTNLDEYPLFREFNLVASFEEFAHPVIVGLCHLKASDGGPFAPPDDATEKRLQLAHPNPNTEVGGIEILDKVAAPFLDCSDLFQTNDEFQPPPVIDGARSLQWGAFASTAQRLLTRALGPVLATVLPDRAEAAVMGSCCLGGATTKFSPWAAVDPFSGPNILSGVNSGDDGLSLINAQSGAVSFIGRLGGSNLNLYTTPVAMAVRPSDNALFVWNNSGDGTVPCCASTGILLTVDPNTGQGTPVSTSTPPQGPLGALAFSPGGDLFGVSTELYSVSPTTGVKTQIGSGFGGLNIAAADFDCSGTLYGVELTLSPTQKLVRIDTITGSVIGFATLSTDIGRIGSIVFMDSGTLVGSAFGGPSGDILFDIDPATGTVSNVRSMQPGTAPQGLGAQRTCSPVILQ